MRDRPIRAMQRTSRRANFCRERAASSTADDRRQGSKSATFLALRGVLEMPDETARIHHAPGWHGGVAAAGNGAIGRLAEEELMARLAVIAVFALVVPLMAGWDPFGFRDAGKPAAESFAEGMKQAKEGMEKLAKIDPLALNKLLDENATLRARIESVAENYSKYRAQDGIIVLQGQDLILRFKWRVGNVELNVWVDDEANKIIQNQTLSKGETFTFWSEAERTMTIGAGSCLSQIKAVFDRYLTTASSIPLPDMSEKYLNQTLRSVGAHKIFVDARPTAKVGNNWSITGELILRSPDKSERSLKEFTISAAHPDKVSVLIDVKSGSAPTTIPTRP
jgi:hypothetical protein